VDGLGLATQRLPRGPKWWMRLRGWRCLWSGDVRIEEEIDWDAPIESLMPARVRLLARGYPPQHVAWRVSFLFASYGVMTFPSALWVYRPRRRR
jgi:hypothetical protein